VAWLVPIEINLGLSVWLGSGPISIPKMFAVLKTLPRKIANYRFEYTDTSGSFKGGFTWTILFLGVIYITVVTIINVVAVGYELVPFISSQYNGSANLWYEGFLPNMWRPVTRSCEPTIFGLGQSCPLSSYH
jgi:hypothetical protein